MTEEEFGALIQQLDALVQEFEALPYPQIRAKVFVLLQAIDTVHRESLGRLIGRLRREGQAELVERMAEDPVIHTLLLLYDLVASEDQIQVSAASFIPLQQISGAPQPRLRQPVFRTVTQLEELPTGTMQAFDVGGVPVLVANLEGELYAVQDTCPGSPAPLHLGSFSPPVVVCPWHNEAFDIRTGKRADQIEGPSLTVFPVRIVDGSIQLTIDTASDPTTTPGSNSQRGSRGGP
ncbi:MAG: nitrite reductase (NAD(P)H) small subunit [Ardenticatenaceae bacterium]|nr:nitrite reductase (NAD(P)H) small subunit [Ardenticatenaceae bacterium]HBY97555.1 hypothetical protein [Chloroflexota bacterium]